MRKSITILEVLVSAVLVATTFAGLISAFVSVRRYITRAEKRLVGANIARGIIENLYFGVREDLWRVSTASLYDAPGDGAWTTHNITEAGLPATVTVGDLSYTGNYQVSEQGTDYREVRVNIMPQ